MLFKKVPDQLTSSAADLLNNKLFIYIIIAKSVFLFFFFFSISSKT